MCDDVCFVIGNVPPSSLAMSDFGQFSLHVGIHLKLGIKTLRNFVELKIWPEITNLCGTE
jgi:hypothetical protein